MASKRHKRRRSCEYKRAYEQSQAIAAAHALRGKTGNPIYEAYSCKFCGRWHVGRMNSRQQQGMNARRRLGGGFR